MTGAAHRAAGLCSSLCRELFAPSCFPCPEADWDRSKHPPKCRVDGDSFLLAADAWERFVSLEHGAGVVVVENNRPKVLRLDHKFKNYLHLVPSSPYLRR
jgi:hypothetical protein